MAEISAVYRLACRLSGNGQAAEDLVQETYLRAFRSAATYSPTVWGIRPWLFKILHNVLYNHGTREKRDRSMLDGLQRQHEDGGFAGSGVLPETNLGSVDWESVDQRLKAAIDELSLDQRMVFLLSAVEGLRYRQIAAIVEVPVGTVMSRLHRARSALASKLSDIAVERGWNRVQKDESHGGDGIMEKLEE